MQGRHASPAWLHPKRLCQPLPSSQHTPSTATAPTQARAMSTGAEGVVYAGPQAPSPKKVTIRVLRSKYAKKEPITMVTAYDYPSAVHVGAYACA